MLEIKRCPKCNGEMIECVFEKFPVVVKGRSPELFENKTTDLIPYVCGSCGYTELYGKDPQNLI